MRTFARPKGFVHPASVLAARAREMRFAPTAPEKLLFDAIRGRRLGVAFRRQVPVLGRYVADLLAPEICLVVEVDGPHHRRRRRADARRDDALRRGGYRVLRLEAELVMHELSVAVGRIRAEVEALRRPR